MGFFLKVDERKINVTGQALRGAVQMSDRAVKLAFASTELESRGFFLDSNLGQISSGIEQLPLLTWPFLDFIGSGDRGFARLVELGSGNSTRWFAKIYKNVVSFETNPEWYEQVKKSLPGNCKLNLIATDDLLNFDFEFEQSDSLLIDFAGKRSLFIKNLLERSRVLPNTVFLDNADWYRTGASLLSRAGYQEIPFFGFKSGQTWLSCTSLFIKDLKALQYSGSKFAVPRTSRLTDNAWDRID